MTERVRAHLAMVQGILRTLDEETRTAVLAALDLETAKDVQKLSKLLDESRENADAWRVHNEQRIVEVQEARKLLRATPSETLPDAIRRHSSGVNDVLLKG